MASTYLILQELLTLLLRLRHKRASDITLRPNIGCLLYSADASCWYSIQMFPDASVWPWVTWPYGAVLGGGCGPLQRSSPSNKLSLGRVGGWGKACPSLSPNIHQAFGRWPARGSGSPPGRMLTVLINSLLIITH